MGHSRPRYNQKGRQASADAAADGKRKRAYEPDDSNAEIIDPAEKKRRREEVSEISQLIWASESCASLVIRAMSLVSAVRYNIVDVSFS
jgi:ATP-dependent RNA helicase DHX37/DHR1